MRDRRGALDELDHDVTNDTRPTPGKLPTTARIARMVMRTSAGADVAPHAEAAIDRARGSSGAPLPDELRGRFEQALGADLSAVRVHTGADSAAATQAVGARAYALGNDIHFAPGQYAPADPFGVHLLAHEVAHTVQQQGAAPSAQYQLEVSSPGDAAEVEADRAADAMVTGTPATIGRATGLARRVIQRAPDPAPPPTPQQTPFDGVKIPPQVQQAIDQLALDSLRSLTSAQVNRLETIFLNACDSAIAAMGKRKAEREESQKQMLELALGAAGLALGPLGSAAGAKIASAAGNLEFSLAASITTRLEARLAQEGLDAQTREALTAKVLEKVTSERVTWLLSQVTPERATGVINVAASKAAGVIAKIDPRGSKEEKAISYIEAVKSSADKSASALINAAGSCTDPATLIAVHQTLSATSIDVLKAEMITRANDFADQIAATIGDNKSDEVVVMNAYGQDRLANVRYLPSSATYSFHSWITPDMEPIARGLNPNPRRISPSAVDGHIPEPVREGAVYGQQLVMRTNAWGRPRLVIVKVDRGFVQTHYGELVFVQWVPKAAELEQETKGSLQIGGVPDVDPARIHDLQAPTD